MIDLILGFLMIGVTAGTGTMVLLANRLGGATIGAVLALAVLWPTSWRDGISRAIVSIGAGWAFGPISLELLQKIGIQSATDTTGQVIAGFLGYPLAGMVYTHAPKVLKSFTPKR